MRLTSTAFEEGGIIPAQHTCDGGGQPPPLLVSEVPVGADSLTLAVSDPDAPEGTFVHWLKRGIPADAADLSGGSEEANSTGRTGWFPPCPPSGVHRYVFTVTAVGMDGRTIGSATLTGVYARSFTHSR